MALQCLTWIPHLWGQLFGILTFHIKGDVELLPDDVIIGILSRLPADCVLQCRMVCKLWRGLTSTRDFVELHLKRATPSLFVHCTLLYRPKLEYVIFNEEVKNDKMLTKIHLSAADVMEYKDRPDLIGSCNGLLLLKLGLGSKFIVYNPVGREQITQWTPYHTGFLCGIYLHPLTREYKVIYGTLIYACATQRRCYYYYVSTLGSKTWRRIASLTFCPAMLQKTGATIVNGSLYWIVMFMHDYFCRYGNAIMVFSTDSENLRVIRHPGNKCCSRENHESMHLFEMKEHLSFCQLCCQLCGKLIDVWGLEDHAKRYWVRKYKVNLDWGVKRYPFDYSVINYRIRMLSIQNGELLLAWSSRGLFLYNLELNTVKKVKRNASRMKERNYYDIFTTVYTKSLVTLNDISAEV